MLPTESVDGVSRVNREARVTAPRAEICGRVVRRFGLIPAPVADDLAGHFDSLRESSVLIVG